MLLAISFTKSYFGGLLPHNISFSVVIRAILVFRRVIGTLFFVFSVMVCNYGLILFCKVKAETSFFHYLKKASLFCFLPQFHHFSINCSLGKDSDLALPSSPTRRTWQATFSRCSSAPLRLKTGGGGGSPPSAPATTSACPHV
jgi:hypothetical protein